MKGAACSEAHVRLSVRMQNVPWCRRWPAKKNIIPRMQYLMGANLCRDAMGIYQMEVAMQFHGILYAFLDIP